MSDAKFFEYWRALNEKFADGTVSKNAYVVYARMLCKVNFKTQSRVVKMPMRRLMAYVGLGSMNMLYSALKELVSAGLVEKFIDEGVAAYKLRVPSDDNINRNAGRNNFRNPSPRTPHSINSDTMCCGAGAQSVHKKIKGEWHKK